MYRKLYPEYSAKLDTAEKIKNYIYGGRGIVTLKAPSGKSHTYIFAKPKNANVFPDDVLFVYALHEGVKQFYVGMIEGGGFRLTNHSRFLPDTEIVKGARYILKMANMQNLDTPMELYHNGMCAFCGRPLTSELSVSEGIGPRCKKMRLEQSKQVQKISVPTGLDFLPDCALSEEVESSCGPKTETTSRN